MDWNGQLELGGLATFVGPALALNGEWGTAAGIAVRESLSRGSLDGVMDVLNGLEGRQLANVLGEAGFPVGEGVVERGQGEGFVTASVVDPFGNVLGIMQNPHYLEMLGR